MWRELTWMIQKPNMSLIAPVWKGSSFLALALHGGQARWQKTAVADWLSVSGHTGRQAAEPFASGVAIEKTTLHTGRHRLTESALALQLPACHPACTCTVLLFSCYYCCRNRGERTPTERWTAKQLGLLQMPKVFGKNVTSDVLYDIGRSFRILIKKLIT
jgi:hypothetical protein